MLRLSTCLETYFWIIAIIAVIFVGLLISLIVGPGCVIILKNRKGRKIHRCHKIEMFTMTKNPVYDNPIHVISNSAYGQIHTNKL